MIAGRSGRLMAACLFASPVLVILLLLPLIGRLEDPLRRNQSIELISEIL